MEFVKIVLAGLLAAVGYGIVHDQITIRVSTEYFTVGHPPVFPSSSPTLIALGWGVLATSWIGLPFGFVLASACRNGRRPCLTLADVVRPIARLLAIVGVAATLAGVVGYALAESGALTLPQSLHGRVPVSHHSRYFAAWWAHGVSYLIGILGAAILIVLGWRKRRRLVV